MGGRARGAQAKERTPSEKETVIWHDLEFGSYRADLTLWRELAARAGGPVLEIGAGTGRLALELAGDGHEVTALEREGVLLEELRARAKERGLDTIETVQADARSFTLEPSSFALCIVPMQTVQLLGGADGRRAFLTRVRGCLEPGGVLACAIVTEVEPFGLDPGDTQAEPEIAQVGGRRYISCAVGVSVEGELVRIERERRVLGAGGGRRGALLTHDVVELARLEVEQLQWEGERVGLRAAGTRGIPASERHGGSVAVIFDA